MLVAYVALPPTTGPRCQNQAEQDEAVSCGSFSGLGSSGLPDLDEIAVRVTHVAANLSAMVLWLGQEFGTSASPLLIRDPDIRDTNIQETGNLIGVLRGTKRHSGFIVGWAATDVHNQPTIGKLDDGGFATANNMASENAHIELR